ncbi:L,D-transpeptidase family protein [Marinicrinis sediminis]|uniref:L,D-transpeptidase family protein n=1 Tax=Marinicrinis sediminis TaxID=1652465 RepID=A0ABW5RA20_9BACL
MSQQIEHLKTYVKEHPTNKMAWYLLGKEYLANGQEQKAAYCFTQAGEIYEAYEKIAFPVDASHVPAPAGSVHPESEMERMTKDMLAEEVTSSPIRRKRKKWLGLGLPVVISLLFLAWSQSVLSPQSGEEAVAKAPAVATDSTSGATTSDQQALSIWEVKGWPEPVQLEAGAASLVQAYVSRQQQDKQTERMIAYASVRSETEASDTGDWHRWEQHIRPVASISSQAQGAGLELEFHDAESCQCEAGPLVGEKQLTHEILQRLQYVTVVKTAIEGYEQRTGSKVKQLQQLIQPYPNNSLSGADDLLQEAFDWVMQEQAQKQAAKTEKSEQAQPSWKWETQAAASISGQKETKGDKKLDQPVQVHLDSGLLEQVDALRIVVDQKQHRLALVSGNTVLRNYPVGLGGERTPEGSFVISEKVMNPNGRADGDFGSRGMTLSDTLYAIHGTNEPDSIGKDESLGCVRMLNEDIEELFSFVPLGTPVEIRGDGQLPEEVIRGAAPFALPSQVEETNPNKRYRWLN